MSKLYAGIDLGGTSMIAVVANGRGKILGSADCPTNRGAAPEETIDLIAEQVRLAAKEAGIKPSKVAGVGIGAPGAVDPDTGVVVKAPNLGWTDVALSEILGKKLKLKKDVVLGNDVQVAVLGEHAFGVAKGTRRAVGIWVGTGIGGGLIVDGKLDRGARGAAGEIGHMVLDEEGPQCSCGRKGCAEAFSSRTSMERDVRAAVAKGKKSAVLQIMKDRDKPRMTSSVIGRALKAEDPIMIDVLSRAQHYLGLLTANVVNLFDPEMVIMGGGVAQRLGEDFVGPIRVIARERFLRPDPNGDVRIEASTLGDYSGALGACALAQMK